MRDIIINFFVSVALAVAITFSMLSEQYNDNAQSIIVKELSLPEKEQKNNLYRQRFFDFKDTLVTSYDLSGKLLRPEGRSFFNDRRPITLAKKAYDFELTL